MRLMSWLAVLVVVCGGAFAQVPQDSTATVTGTVTDAKTSQSIRGAQIVFTQISGGGSRQQTTSDAEGHFSISGLQPGNYRVFIQARGYIPKIYGSTNQPSSGPAISAKAGQHLSDLAFALKQMGIIHGRVVNSDGDPMVRCAVQALQVNARRNQPRGMSGGQTDDRGEYRIFDLVPGDYYVIANCQGAGGMSMPLGASGDPAIEELSYVPMYYPGVPSLKEASVVSIHSADEMSVDISVTRQKTYHVRGSVTGTVDTPGVPPPMALLVPRDLAIVQGPRMAAVVNGNFDVRGVTPGSYVLVVTLEQPNSQRKVAREDVEVGAADVDGLTLVLGSMASIKGTLRVEGGMPPNTNLSLLVVDLQASEAGALAGPSLTGTSAQARLKPDGTFEIPEVAPGNYMVGLTASGTAFRDWYTKSVHFAGRDVTDAGLRIGSGTSGSLEILVSARGASVEGTVVDSNNQPVPNVGVMAIPDESRRKRWDLYDGGRTDDRGHFELRGLAAGDYSVVAAQDLDMDDRFDVDTMTKFAQEGTRVRLEDADHKTVQLNPSASVTADSR